MNTYSIKIYLMVLFNIIFISSTYSQRINVNDGQINKFVEKIPVEVGVGQLFMIGIPADIENRNVWIDSLIVEYNFGNVVLNSYNLVSRNVKSSGEYSKILQFSEYLQSKAFGNKIPLLIAANFENETISALPPSIYQAPSALSIGCTRDTILIRNIGRSIAKKLNKYGINVILGPVLDVYSTVQGTLNPIERNRCFGGSPKIVFNIASHFINGLKEGGVLTIGKHYPGLGSVDEDPHSKIPLFNGTPKQLNSELLPYPSLTKQLDGIMTSHLTVNCIVDETPVTFSDRFVTDLLRNDKEIIPQIKGIGFKNGIVITDDLSDMNSIFIYANEKLLSNVQIAEKAFLAGHDILLYCHIDTPGQLSKSVYHKFNYSNLIQIKNHFVDLVKTNPIFKARYVESLVRIIKTKLNQFDHNNKTCDFDLDKVTRGCLNERTDSLEIYGQKVFDSAMILLNKQIDYRINSSDSEIITFCVDENNINKFNEAFKNRNKFHIIPIPRNNKRIQFENLKTEILNALEKSDRLVFTVNSKDDINLLDHLFIKNKTMLKKKCIVFLHQNPAIVLQRLISSVTLLGNFSGHDASYNSDVSVLLGKIEPHKSENLTISFNNSEIFDTDPRIKPALNFPVNKFISPEQSETDSLQNSISLLKTTMQLFEIFFIFILFLIFLSATLLLLKYLRKNEISLGKIYKTKQSSLNHKILKNKLKATRILIPISGILLIADLYFLFNFNQNIFEFLLTFSIGVFCLKYLWDNKNEIRFSEILKRSPFIKKFFNLTEGLKQVEIIAILLIVIFLLVFSMFFQNHFIIISDSYNYLINQVKVF